MPQTQVLSELGVPGFPTQQIISRSTVVINTAIYAGVILSAAKFVFWREGGVEEKNHRKPPSCLEAPRAGILTFSCTSLLQVTVAPLWAPPSLLSRN